MTCRQTDTQADGQSQAGKGGEINHLCCGSLVSITLPIFSPPLYNLCCAAAGRSPLMHAETNLTSFFSLLAVIHLGKFLSYPSS